MAKPISIIIVNWNASTLLQSCLESILEFHAGLIETVLVVDNDSHDGSADCVGTLEARGVDLRLIRNSNNRGFAAACNQGALLTESEYLVFLNPDTRLFADSLAIPLYYLQQDANAAVGIVGIQLLDNSGVVARSCSRFPSGPQFFAHVLSLDRLPMFRRYSTRMSEWDHGSTSTVDQVIGAFFFVRRSVYAALNGFDECFFVYFEEVDFSLRAREAGYRSVYLATARAFHLGGGTSRQVRAHRLFYSLRSRMRYVTKHFSPTACYAVLLLTLVVEPFARLLEAICRLRRDELAHTLRAYGMLYRDLIRALIQRVARLRLGAR